MPQFGPITITEADADKAFSTTKDFYGDLSDAEREEEGIPPAPSGRPEEPSADPEPAVAPEPGDAPQSEPKPTPEPESDDDSAEAARALLDEIAALREDLAASLERPRAEAAPARDELMEAAAEDDNPVVQGLAKRLQESEAKLASTEKLIREQIVARQEEHDERAYSAVMKVYTIDGQTMTSDHVDQIDQWFIDNPDIARRVSIEQATRIVFPGASRLGTKPSPTAVPKKNGTRPVGDAPPVATIVDRGASSGGPPAGKFKPRPNESIESAVQEFGRTRGWIR